MYNSSDWAKECERLEAERDRLVKILQTALNALAPQTRYQKSSKYRQLAISEAQAVLKEARKP